MSNPIASGDYARKQIYCPSRVVAWSPGSSVDPLSYQPRQDTIGVDDPNIYAFGSAHSGAMNMAMCDGSVQSISYDIDRDAHRYLANRMEGHVGTLAP